MCAALLLAVASCERAGEKTPSPQDSPGAQVACNDVAINPSVSVSPGGAVAAISSEEGLIGGPIAPGTYDLTGVEQRGGAAQWTEQVWRTVRITDSEEGQTLEFATARGSSSATPERFSARLREEPAGLVFTCGRDGEAPTSWTVQANNLQLLLPAETGNGETVNVFARRTR